MKKKKEVVPRLTAAEKQLLEQLRQKPALMERFQNLLDITNSTLGPLKTADEVEGLLIDELRRVGNVSLGQWAAQAEVRVGEELQRQDRTVRSRKKKR